MIPSAQSIISLVSDSFIGVYTTADLQRAIDSGNIREIIEISYVLGMESGSQSFDVYETEEYKDLENEIRGHKKEIDAIEDRMHAAESDAFNKACEITKLKDQIAGFDRPESEIVTEIQNELDFQRGENERLEKICVDICWDTKFRNKFMKSARYAEIQAKQK